MIEGSKLLPEVDRCVFRFRNEFHWISNNDEIGVFNEKWLVQPSRCDELIEEYRKIK